MYVVGLIADQCFEADVEMGEPSLFFCLFVFNRVILVLFYLLVGLIADQCVKADIEMCEAGLLQGRQPSSQSHTVGCHPNCLQKKILQILG